MSRATNNSQWAADARASTFDADTPIGNADIGFSVEDMKLLRDVMLLVPMLKEKKIDRATFKQMRDDYIARLNQLDLNIMGRWRPRAVSQKQANNTRISSNAPQVRSHRPMAYVPYWKGRKLILPNAFAINRRLGKSYQKAAGHKLMAVLGEQHLAMMGFATRPKSGGSKGRTIWTPGQIRAYKSPARRNVVSTKSFGWYRSASGTPVFISARTTSRLGQMVYNNRGKTGTGLPQFNENRAFESYDDTRSGRTFRINMGTFLNPHVGADGLANGEMLRKVVGKNGVAAYKITTMSNAVSGARGVGGSDVFRTDAQKNANAKARAKKNGGGGRNFSGTPEFSLLPRVGPVPFRLSPLAPTQGVESDMDTSGSGVLGSKRRLEGEA